MGIYSLGGLESGGLESGGLLWGSRVWGSTGLGLPISDLEPHMPVVKKHYRGPFNVNVSLLSRATDFGSGVAHAVYTLGVYSLGLPILDLVPHMPVRKKHYRGPFNVNVV